MTTPKYVVLKKTIKDWALSGHLRPGEQIPTEAQLAEQFQMSRQTVRMALNELVHEHFLKRFQGRGTFLSDTLFNSDKQTESHQLIAVITTYISDYIFPSIIRGIEARLSDDNYTMILLSTNNDFDKEAQALDSILRRPIDGVIVEPTKSTHNNPNLRRYLRLLNRKVPIVMLHSAYTEMNLPIVCLDDELGGSMAVDHLFGFGHTRIGMLSKEDDIQGRLRLKGFISAHVQQRASLYPEWIRLYTTDDRDTTCSQYVDSFCAANEESRPTAIVCYNDEIASELVKKFSEDGVKVPDDVSIVSFDDSQWAIDNDVTSIQHPKYEMGVIVAEKILDAIRSQSEPITDPHDRDFRFKPTLVIRSSSQNISGFSTTVSK